MKKVLLFLLSWAFLNSNFLSAMEEREDYSKEKVFFGTFTKENRETFHILDYSFTETDKKGIYNFLKNLSFQWDFFYCPESPYEKKEEDYLTGAFLN